MTLDVWFWLFMALWFLMNGWIGYIPEANRTPYHRWGGSLLLFLVLLIIGLRVFGSPVK